MSHLGTCRWRSAVVEACDLRCRRPPQGLQRNCTGIFSSSGVGCGDAKRAREGPASRTALAADGVTAGSRLVRWEVNMEWMLMLLQCVPHYIPRIIGPVQPRMCKGPPVWRVTAGCMRDILYETDYSRCRRGVISVGQSERVVATRVISCIRLLFIRT